MKSKFFKKLVFLLKTHPKLTASIFLSSTAFINYKYNPFHFHRFNVHHFYESQFNKNSLKGDFEKSKNDNSQIHVMQLNENEELEINENNLNDQEIENFSLNDISETESIYFEDIVKKTSFEQLIFIIKMQDMNELKEMVLKKMQESGVLGQLKAQMRAKVFDIIDSQEKTSDDLSALYLNNPKIQSAKKNQITLEAMEIFVDFLDAYKLTNTKEIFKSETNFKYNQKIKKELEEKFSENKKPLALQILQKWKNSKQNKNQSKAQNSKKQDYKNQMSDLQKKSEQLDFLIQKKNKQIEEKNKDSDLDSQEEELKKPSKKQLIHISPQKKKDLFENLQLKQKIEMQTNSSQNSKIKVKKSIEKTEDKIITISHKESLKTSSQQNFSERQDTDNMIISESHGYDVTVETVALEDFDYIESINDSVNDQQLNQ